jgi:nicotinate phosphoribosyltransferase
VKPAHSRGQKRRPPQYALPPDAALFTDLYQLTMAQAYWRERMHATAVFTLFTRRLPKGRNYLLACGLADALVFLERARFTMESLDYLASLSFFRREFLDWLAGFRFSGDVYAVPEGTPVFAGEPVLEVVAPIIEAQLVETFVMNQLHFQTVAATKASRVVAAAQGRRVVDFGLRRMHGSDAGVKSARAFYVAGVDATSNVLAGKLYGVPVAGTMAHSYIQAHDSELDAFRAILELYPDTILLVDTYDTLRGVERVIRLATELGDAFRVRGIRIDSGDLGTLAGRSRALLDAAGLNDLEIFASGGLDENEIRRLLRGGAPIDGFGVGTAMGVSADVPALDMAYKLAEYGGRGRLKTSPGKPILPGRKQVYRSGEDGRVDRDVIARWGEQLPGRPLLRQVMYAGVRLPEADESLAAARSRAGAELAALPTAVSAIDAAVAPFPVEISAALAEHQRRTIAAVSS